MDVLTNKKQQTVSLQCRIQQSNIIKNHYELEFSYIELPNVNKVNNQILILNENQTQMTKLMLTINITHHSKHIEGNMLNYQNIPL